MSPLCIGRLFGRMQYFQYRFSLSIEIRNLVAAVSLSALLVGASAPLVFANTGINVQMHYQGLLRDGAGTAVSDGNYDMVFRLYSAASGGTALWTGTHTAGNGNAVGVTNGVFSVLLGSGTGNSLAGVDFNQDSLWLGVTVGTDSEMSPRQRLAASAYAFNADRLDGVGLATSTLATGDILYFDGTALERLAAGSDGEVLKLASGIPRWAADAAGGGFFASSSASVMHPADTSDVLVLGGTATTTAGYIFEVIGSSLFDDVQFVNATSSGALSIGGALGIGSEVFTDFTGEGLTNTGGTLTVATSTLTVATSTYAFESGTSSVALALNGFNQSDYLTVSAWNATTTDALAEGMSNVYWTQGRFDTALLATSSLPHLSVGTSSVALALNGFNQNDYLTLSAWNATTTDALAEGGANLYWTHTRFDERLAATTTLPNLAVLEGVTNLVATNATTTNATSTNLFASVARFTASIIDNFTTTNLVATNATTTNATTTNGYIASLTAGHATSTNLAVSGMTTLADTVNSGALTVNGLSTLGNASTTNVSVAGALTTALSANSVPFIGAAGRVSEDGSNFVWDDANNRLGIGTTSPSASLAVAGAGLFTGSVVAQGALLGTSFQNGTLRVGVTATGEIDTASGNLTLDSNGGTVLIDDELSVAATTTLAGVLNLSSNRILGVGTPTLATDAANKEYVDSFAQGLVWQEPVLTIGSTTPPSSPTTGDRHIVAGSGAAGAWAGEEHNIAEWSGAAWEFASSTTGYSAFVSGAGRQYTYNNTEWVELGSGTSHASLSGLQGGNGSDQFYHLNLTDWNALTDVNAQLAALHTDGSPIFAGLTAARATTTNATSTNLYAGTLTLGNALAVAHGGTGTTTAQTGGLFFYDGATFTQDAPNLFWNNATKQLGIGTSTPQGGLHVESDAAFVARFTRSQTGADRTAFFDIENGNATTSVWRFASAGTGNGLGMNDGQFYIESLGTPGAAKFIIERDGDIGIGDTTPDGKFEIRQTGTEDIFNLYDGGTNVLTVLDGGSVGIGTSSPAQRFSVAGSGEQNIAVHSTDNSAVGAYLTNSVSSWRMYNAGGNGGLRFNNGTSSASDRLALFSTGNVSVGSQNAGSRLAVAGNATVGVNYDTAFAPANGLLVEGNVGIGTTTPAAALTVSGDAYVGGNLTATGTVTFSDAANGILVTDNAGAVSASSTIAATLVEDAFVRNTGDSISGNLLFSGSAANIGLGSNWLSGDGDDEGIFVASNGNVGIGTNTPGTFLDISVNNNASRVMQIQNTSAGASARAQLQFVNDANQQFQIGMGSSNFTFGPGHGYLWLYNPNSDMRFGTNNLDRMRLLANGHFGVGDLTPAALFTVGNGDRFQVDESGNVRLAADGTSFTVGAGNDFFISHDGTNSFVGSNTGNLIIDNTNATGETEIQLGSDTSATAFQVLNNSGATLFEVDGAGNTALGTTAPEGSLDIVGAPQGTITTLGSEAPGLIVQQQHATSGLVYGPMLELRMSNAANEVWTSGAIVGVDDGGFSGELAFFTQPGGTSDPTGRRTRGNDLAERLRIDKDGLVGIGTTQPSARLDVVDISTSTTAATTAGLAFAVTDTGVVTTGADTLTGLDLNITRTGATGGTITTRGLDLDVVGDAGGASTATGLDVAVSGADTNYAAVFTGGNVGIGTTTPSDALTIATNANVAQKIRFTNASAGTFARSQLEFTNDVGNDLQIGMGSSNFTFGPNHGFIWLPDAGSDLRFGTDGEERMRLLSGGNFGVGDLTPAALFTVGNGDRFQVDASGNVRLAADGTSFTVGAGNDVTISHDGTNTFLGSATGNLIIDNTNTTGETELQLGTDTEATALQVLNNSGAALFEVEGNGQVGIGTAAPSTFLDIVANNNGSQVVQVTNQSSGTDARSQLQFTNDANRDLQIGIGSSNFTFGPSHGYVYTTEPGSDLRFGTGNIERARILSNGSFGIGTNAPAQRLHVSGSGNERILVQSTGANQSVELNLANTHGRWAIYNAGTDGALHFYNDTAPGGDRVRIQENGNMALGAFTAAVKLDVDGDIQVRNQGDLRFADADSSHSVGFQAPGTVSANVLWTLPAADGGGGQVLATNGSGALSWSDVALGTNTTGAYVATVADAGAGDITVTGSGGESAAVTLDITDDSLDFTEFSNTLTVDESTTVTLGGSNSLTFNLAGTGDFAVQDNGQPALFVTDGGGGVGIGTDAPAQRLHVSGDGNERLLIQSTSNSSVEINLENASSTWAIYNAGGGNGLRFFQGGDRVTFANDGNVGIGSGSPDGKLEVRQTGTADIFNLYDNTTNVFTVLDGGNVGVGVTNPIAKLQIGTLDASDGSAIAISGEGAGSGEGGELQLYFAADHDAEAVSGEFAYLDAFENDIRFGNVGTAGEIMRLTGEGNVGIGTAAPTNALSVHGGITIASTSPSATANALYNQGGTLYWNGTAFTAPVTGTQGQMIVINSSGTQSATSELFINASSNVGIGTTNPDGRLHVHSASAGAVAAHPNADDLVVENSGNSGLSVLAPDANEANIFFGSPSDQIGGFVQWVHNNDLLTLGTDNPGADIRFSTGAQVEAMRILDNGYVGIGTAAPTAALHIQGTGYPSSFIHFDTDATAQDVGMRFYEGGVHKVNIFHEAGTITDTLKIEYLGGDNYLNLTSDGTVLLHADPTRELNLRGRVVGINNGAEDSILELQEFGIRRWQLMNDNTTDQLQIHDIDSHVAWLVQNATGWGFTSDARLKENVAELSVLDKLDAYRAVSYAWRDTGEMHIGVVAQELYEVFPEFVSVGTPTDEALPDTREGSWGVEYASLAPVALQGVKELSEITFGTDDNALLIATSTFPHGLVPALASLADREADASDDSFLGQVFARFRAWFADTANGIATFVAGEVRTEKLCVGEVCVTETELKALLAHKSTSASSHAPANDAGTPPTISIIGANPAELTVGTPYSDLGATAHDAEQGDLSVTTHQRSAGESEWQAVNSVFVDTEVAGEHEIRYEAVDNDGNTAHAVRTVIVTDPDADTSPDTATTTPDTATTTPDTTPQPKDTTPPTITLNGDSALTLTLGDTYTEEGATATDLPAPEAGGLAGDADGDLTSSITVSGSVDTQTVGEYRITYTVSDAAGNEATAVRTVSVVAAESAQESTTEPDTDTDAEGDGVPEDEEGTRE